MFQELAVNLGIQAASALTNLVVDKMARKSDREPEPSDDDVTEAAKFLSQLQDGVTALHARMDQVQEIQTHQAQKLASLTQRMKWGLYLSIGSAGASILALVIAILK